MIPYHRASTARDSRLSRNSSITLAALILAARRELHHPPYFLTETLPFHPLAVNDNRRGKSLHQPITKTCSDRPNTEFARYPVTVYQEATDAA